jgi:hypothetical protein
MNYFKKVLNGIFLLFGVCGTVLIFCMGIYSTVKFVYYLMIEEWVKQTIVEVLKEIK